jgi:DNA repair protein RadA
MIGQGIVSLGRSYTPLLRRSKTSFQAQPDVFFGDPTKPAGGHACTYRIYLKKAGQERVATIIDSRYHPYSDTRFIISEKGVEDPEPKKTKEA